ncbi:DUF3817 domain-containing protein [Nonomuraea terrae]|uniref:DUF3817 domain-containing protein n=1 Tax=Nonomuraea terrae TaxID=2530383 RepID=UPI003791E15D
MERTLRAAAAVEAVSLVILLVNVFTVHNEAITSLGGPLHGSAYLTVIVTTLLLTPAAGTRRRAAVPGIGGLLAVRRLRRHSPGD